MTLRVSPASEYRCSGLAAGFARQVLPAALSFRPPTRRNASRPPPCHTSADRHSPLELPGSRRHYVDTATRGISIIARSVKGFASPQKTRTLDRPGSHNVAAIRAVTLPPSLHFIGDKTMSNTYYLQQRVSQLSHALDRLVRASDATVHCTGHDADDLSCLACDFHHDLNTMLCHVDALGRTAHSLGLDAYRRAA